MAGFFIKWEKGLTEKPEVIQMASELGIDRYSVAGRLMRIWEWADENVAESDFDPNGHAFVTLTAQHLPFIDALVGLAHFAGAMSAVGWLKNRDGRIMLPNFGRHNGKTAKTRALASQRQSKQRAKKAVTNPSRKRHAARVTRSVSVSDSDSSHSGKGESAERGGKPPSPQRVFTDHFVRCWGSRYGTKYRFLPGADGTAAAAILKHFEGNAALACAAADRYFADPDEWPSKARHSLSFFNSQLNRWTSDRPKGTPNAKPADPFRGARRPIPAVVLENHREAS